MTVHLELGLLVFLLFSVLLFMYVMLMGDSERHEKVPATSPASCAAHRSRLRAARGTAAFGVTCVCERARLCLHLRPCLCLCDAWRAARAGLHRLPLPAARRHDGVFQQVRALLCATRRCAGAPGGSHSASARVAVSRPPPIGLPSDWFAHKLESIVGKACCARLYAWQDYVFYQKNPIMPSIYVIFVGTGFTVFAMVCALPSRCIAPPRHPSRTVWAWRGFARPLSSRARALSLRFARTVSRSPSLARARARSLTLVACFWPSPSWRARALRYQFAFPFIPFGVEHEWGISFYHKINAFWLVGLCAAVFYANLVSDPGCLHPQTLCALRPTLHTLHPAPQALRLAT